MLKTKDPLEAWAQLQTFLAACTDRTEPDSIELAVRSDFASRAEFAALGSPSRSRRVGDFDEIVWSLPNESVPRWLSASAACADDSGLCVLVHAVFRLVDPESHLPLPGQDPDLYHGQEAAPQRLLGRSQFYARLSRRSTVNLFLSLPLDEPGVEFHHLLAALQARLPFRLSSRHWRHWRRRARGVGLVGKRLDLSSA